MATPNQDVGPHVAGRRRVLGGGCTLLGQAEAFALRDHVATLAGGREFYDLMEEEIIARRLLVQQRNPLVLQRRMDFTAEEGALVFSATAGTVVGPLRAGEHYDVVRVIHTQAASRDDAATETALGDAIFDEWLAARRRKARIEWFWGPAR